MHQAVFARQDVDERAKVHELRHLALVDLAHFDVRRQVLDALARRVVGGFVIGVDLDDAVVVYVYGRARLLGEGADGGAALADHIADLVRVDLDGGDAGRMLGHLRARFGEDAVHLLQDVQASLPGLLQRRAHDLLGDAVHLDVHLQGADPPLGACHLEVHVPQVVFIAHDVGQHDEFVLLLDKAHGDARHRRRDAYAGVHQGQAGAAHRGHGAGAVGFGDLGDDADHIGELLQIRHHRHHPALRQPAVADLAALGRAGASGLAYAIRGKVVVQHEGVFALSLYGVDDLRVPPRA